MTTATLERLTPTRVSSLESFVTALRTAGEASRDQQGPAIAEVIYEGHTYLGSFYYENSRRPAITVSEGCSLPNDHEELQRLAEGLSSRGRSFVVHYGKLLTHFVDKQDTSWKILWERCKKRTS